MNIKDSDFFKDIKPLTKYTDAKHPSRPVSTEVPPHYFSNTELSRTTNTHPFIAQEAESYRYTPKQSIHIKKNRGFSGIWFFAFIAFLVLIYSISKYFAVATITINPKVYTVSVNETITLNSSQGPFAYETLSVEGSIPVESTYTEKVLKKEKTRGTVIFSNSYSLYPQKLLKNTRLVSSQGNIYLTDTAVTVPGYTLLEGQKVPGQITAPITAFGIGEIYNVLDQDTFKIVSYRGTPRFDFLFAKNKDPLLGGLNGEYFTVSPNQENAHEVHNQALSLKLNELIQKQIPDTYVYVLGLSSISSKNDNALFSKTEVSQSVVSGEITQIVLNKESFQNYLTKLFTDVEHVENIDTSLLKGMILKHEMIQDQSVYTINLKGEISSVSSVDINQIKENLRGLKKAKFNESMASLPEVVASAGLTIKPFWIKTIPSKINGINVYIENGR